MRIIIKWIKHQANNIYFYIDYFFSPDKRFKSLQHSCKTIFPTIFLEFFIYSNK